MNVFELATYVNALELVPPKIRALSPGDRCAWLEAELYRLKFWEEKHRRDKEKAEATVTYLYNRFIKIDEAKP